MNDRRFLLFSIPLVAWLELLPRGLLSIPFGLYWLVAYATSLFFTLTLWLGVRQLWWQLLRRWPQPEQSARRLGWLAGLGVSYTVLLIL